MPDDKVADFLSDTNKKVEKAIDKIKNKKDELFDHIADDIAELKKNVKKSQNNDVSDSEKNKEKSKTDTEKEKLNDILHHAIDEYNLAYTILNDNGNRLFISRTRAVDLIINVEKLINSIANRPKKFDTDIATIVTHRNQFTSVCEYAKKEIEAAQKSALGVGAGVTAGAAIASVAPTAALWIATTFGTASTGTAISTLSGAVAANAALAWLGGGSLAAGGGGMAAGEAFLAMAGPIGWAVAGATLLTSITLFTIKKIKLDKQKKEEIDAVKKNTNTTKVTAAKIQEIIDETEALYQKLTELYDSNIASYGSDFLSLSEEQQMSLAALVNNTKALAVTLEKNIE